MTQATATKNTRMSDAAVQAKTGKTWPEWFTILDAAGAAKRDHKGIVAYLSEHHKVGPWWRQMVTVAYEQERGLREKHQTPNGYQISATKTLAVPLGTLYKAWATERARARWLPVPELTVRKATPNKSMRITWVDGKTSVEVNFYGKGSGKSQVTVQHSKLGGARAAERMKTVWAEALDRLKRTLEA